jgi:hypothetical protein
VTDERVKIRKESILASSRYRAGISLEGQRKLTRASNRAAGVPAEIRNQYPLNTVCGDTLSGRCLKFSLVLNMINTFFVYPDSAKLVSIQGVHTVRTVTLIQKKSTYRRTHNLSPPTQFTTFGRYEYMATVLMYSSRKNH